MKSWERKLFHVVLLGTPYLLASPVYLVVGIARFLCLVGAYAIIKSGRVICDCCGHENVLNRLATCNRCHATEYGSLLYCSFCHQVTQVLTCGKCGVTQRVIPKGWWW